MTTKTFFRSPTGIASLLVIASLGIFVYRTYFSNPRYVEAPITPEQGNGTTTQLPVFTWRFEEADSLNLDGNPETDVFVDAHYSDGSVIAKRVDTTPGSCNEVEGGAQCYSAGLGYKFKIVKGDRVYLIQRQMFEEASPEYDPPVYEYETIAEFSL